ncbi:unnamed protein product [Adineta steineri]|uniref:Uncharacterized protein n=1 Tax=Adineta steineri TaxID=433720 RepID=A0A814CSY0_9BILA|nr:unnamed protein product [Adineta steineri]
MDEDNKLNYRYFQRTFPDAIELIERRENISRSIPSDQNDNFTWNWDNNVIYDQMYSDPRNDRVVASTTIQDKMWTFLGVG